MRPLANPCFLIMQPRLAARSLPSLLLALGLASVSQAQDLVTSTGPLVEHRSAELHVARMLARGEAVEVEPGRYQRS